MQADDEIIIPHDNFYIIPWETNFEDFPTNSDSKNTPDDYSADSDQQDAIITGLDIRSTRQDENADDAAPEEREHEIDNADLRSTRLQQDTSSSEAEQPAENTADADLRQQNTEFRK